MQNPAAGGGSPSLRQGLIIGVILGIILIIFALLGNIANLGVILFILSVVIALGAYFYAGLRASQLTERVSTGALAGLWTALISSLLYSAYLLIYTLVNIDTLVRNAQAAARQAGATTLQYTNGLLIGGVIFYIVVVIIISVLVGLGLGALGGFIGKGRSTAPAHEYQESMFQPMADQRYQPLQSPTPEGQPYQMPPPPVAPDEPPAMPPTEV